MNKNHEAFSRNAAAWKEALIEEQEKTEQLIQQDQSNFRFFGSCCKRRRIYAELKKEKENENSQRLIFL